MQIRDPPIAPPRRIDRLARIRSSPAPVTPVVFALLSSLAEGADRIVAREALELLSEPGVVLRAILPVDASDYMEDFGSESSRREFQELLARASPPITMPRGNSREQAYARAGRYVVDHCDVLLAIWDGKPGRGPGGTEETIMYAKARNVPTLIVSDSSPDDTTARNHHPHRKRPRSPAAARALRRFDEYNRLRMDGEPILRQLQKERANLEEWGEEASPIQHTRRLVVDWALPYWVRADTLACKYQRRHHMLGVMLFVFAALAVTSAAAPDMGNGGTTLSLVEVTLMLLLIVGLFLGRKADWHDRWIGYRSLAEAFRSSPFIALAGVHDQHERHIGRREDHWFQRAFSEAWAGRPQVKIDTSGAAAMQRFLIKAWIGEQRKYHDRAAEGSRRARRLLSSLVGVFFGATLVAALLEVLNGRHEPLTFLTITLPAFGAAVTGIRDQRQYAQNQKRSERTVARLEALRSAAESATSPAAVQSLAAEAQTIIDDENNEWWSVAEFQDLELVT
jgi:hypothetical protein